MNNDTFVLEGLGKNFTGGEVVAVAPNGERITLALHPADVADPTEDPTYLAGYHNAEYRADEVSPPILVDRDEGKYRTFDQYEMFELTDVRTSIQANVPEVDPKSALQNYLVEDRAIGAFIPQVTEDQGGNAYAPRRSALRKCSNKIQLFREKEVWDLLTTAGSWNANNVQAAAAVWDGGSGDPILDLHRRIEASAMSITGIWLNQKAANAMLRTDSVRDQMRQMLGDGAAGATLQMVNQAMGRPVDFEIPALPPFHVSAAKYYTGTALDYILGKYAVLVHTPPGVPEDGEDVATTYTWRRRGAAGVGFVTREYRVESRGALGGTMVVATVADVPKMTSNIVGGLVTGILS